jgi:general secretion pathway protein D
VPVTTFSPIATGGIAQQPITSFIYENIGVNIEITPRTHFDNAVTLALVISVTSISNTAGFGGAPTFGNREIKTQIRLQDGETNMLAGLIRDDERRTRDGVLGLSDLPGVGHLFGHSSNERNQTDIILMLTPRIVRVLDLTEEDLRAFQMGRGAAPSGLVGAPAGGVDLPLPGQPPPAPSPEDTQPQPGGIADPAKPIMPPVPQPQQPQPGRPPSQD